MSANLPIFSIGLPSGRKQSAIIRPTARVSAMGKPVYQVFNFSTGRSVYTDDLSKSWFSKALPWIAGAVGAVLIPGVGAALGGVLGGVGAAVGTGITAVTGALGGIGTAAGALGSSLGGIGTAVSAVEKISGGQGSPSGAGSTSAAYAQEAALIAQNQTAINNGSITDAQLTAIVNASPTTVPQGDPNFTAWAQLQAAARTAQITRANTAAMTAAQAQQAAQIKSQQAVSAAQAAQVAPVASAAPAPAVNLQPYIQEYQTEAGYVAQYTPVYQNSSTYIQQFTAQGNTAAAQQWQTYQASLGQWLQSATQWLTNMKAWLAGQGASV